MIKNLKSLRVEKGISQQQLANIIGTSQQSINKYENHNIEPDISTLIALADYFDTTIDYLVGREDLSPITTSYDLSKDEVRLIKEYRKLSDKGKEFIENVTKLYNHSTK